MTGRWSPGMRAGVVLSSSRSRWRAPAGRGLSGRSRGDGDRAPGVVDRAAQVQQVAGEGTVLVGVMKGGVEPGGQPGFGVVGQQPEHHLQATSLQPGPGPFGGGVHLIGGQLGRDRGQPAGGVLDAGGRRGDLLLGGGDRLVDLVLTPSPAQLPERSRSRSSRPAWTRSSPVRRRRVYRRRQAVLRRDVPLPGA